MYVKGLFSLLLSIGLTTALLSSEGTFKRYPLRSGIVYYDLNTSSTLHGTSSQVTGIARLVFDQWGARELKEEDASEIQTGDFNETRQRRSMSLFDHGTVYTVDFDEHAIYKTRDRSMDLEIARGSDLSGQFLDTLRTMHAQKIGNETVAGYPCDLWRLKDQTLCLYRDSIPLKIVIDQPGFHSERTAIQAVFDRPVAAREFALPDFPVTVDEEYTSNAAAATRAEDYIASIRDLRKKFKELGIGGKEANGTLTPAQERAVIDTLGARYLAKQKRYLPRLAEAIEAAKDCIARAPDAQAAKGCIEPIDRIDEKLGDRTESFDFKNFDESKRTRILKRLDEELNYLKVTEACVQKYDRTSEVIRCTEGTLGEEQEPTPAAPSDLHR